MGTSPVAAVRVTLNSGKTVVLREMEIQDQETAAAAIGAEKNPALAGMKMNKELLKLLILEIDGKSVSRTELEKINTLFKPREFNQLLKYLAMELGDDSDPKLETLISGGQ